MAIDPPLPICLFSCLILFFALCSLALALHFLVACCLPSPLLSRILVLVQRYVFLVAALFAVNSHTAHDRTIFSHIIFAHDQSHASRYISIDFDFDEM